MTHAMSSITAVRLAAQSLVGLMLLVIAGVSIAPAVRGDERDAPHRSVLITANESGWATTINVADLPVVATRNPFFLDLGMNGRRCVTCDEPATNMTVTPASLRARFEATEGLDPIFRTNDGSNSPLAEVDVARSGDAGVDRRL
jgi:hypothetical protein